MSVAEDIESMRKESAAKAVEAERLAELAKLYPDLRKRIGRWNKVTYFSKAANATATGVDLRHNCGCCSDSPVEAWPYAETPYGRVYSDPPVFWVGERCDYSESGERADEGWDLKMREAGIPEPTIARVGAYLGVSSETGSVADRTQPAQPEKGEGS
jgi:hypothetical protein